MTMPQPQAPQIPTHIPFPPKQTQASSSTEQEGLQQQDLASRLSPGYTIWFPLIQCKKTAAEVGGAPTPNPPGSPWALLRLWGHSTDQHREKEGLEGLR